MAVSWHLTVRPDGGERFDDEVTFDVMGEVLSLVQNFKLGKKLRTRRPEPGEAVHEFEHGAIHVSRNNYQTVKKRRGVRISGGGWI